MVQFAMAGLEALRPEARRRNQPLNETDKSGSEFPELRAGALDWMLVYQIEIAI